MNTCTQVAAIAAADGRGAALRLPFEELNDSGKLEHALSDSLHALKLQPSSVDLFLDLETLSLLPEEYRTAAGIVSVMVDVLHSIVSARFRNIVICGSSIPEGVDKSYDGSALRVERTEFLAWQSLIEMFDDPLIRFADYGVIYVLEQDVNKPVRPPARIRISTPNQHVLWRAQRKDYLTLCEQVVGSSDFDPELAAWGATALRQCARYGGGKGGPTEWVARDTNLHIEVTVRAMESLLRRSGRLASVTFADPEFFPWNQTLIDSLPRSSPSPIRR